jgi:hypothetical protein
MSPAGPVRLFEYFDVVTLGALAIIITWLVLIHRRKHGALLGTISQTVAASPRSSLLFSLSMTVFYPLYYAFIWLWVGPKTEMPTSFYWLLAISAIFEMIFVWVPHSEGKRVIIHQAAASVVFICMFIMTVLLLMSGHDISSIADIGLVIFLMSSLIFIGLLKLQQFRKNTFLFETLCCVLFLAAISLVAHT